MTEKPEAPAGEQSLAFECDLDAAPETVWRALTEQELLAQWLMPGDMRAEIGAQFSFRRERRAANDDAAPAGAQVDETIDCEVLEADPPHRLSYSWREGPAGAGGLDSTVTFVLNRRAGGGTRLVIVHDGFAALPSSRQPATSCAALRRAA